METTCRHPEGEMQAPALQRMLREDITDSANDGGMDLILEIFQPTLQSYEYEF